MKKEKENMKYKVLNFVADKIRPIAKIIAVLSMLAMLGGLILGNVIVFAFSFIVGVFGTLVLFIYSDFIKAFLSIESNIEKQNSLLQKLIEK